MAYTSSFLAKTTYGNNKIMHIRVTGDAASGSVTSGLDVIDFIQHSPQSATTAGYRVFINSDAALSAENGTVAISGAASGDVIFMTVYGH
jgi:hypothetical protein